VTDHLGMTQMWTFVTADDEPTARERALTHACHGDVAAGGTTSDAIELEPGRWRVMVALQPAPLG
jgi:hypothetical protein